MSDLITPFRIAVTDNQLEDLKRRLRATRWPDRECVDDWTQGFILVGKVRLACAGGAAQSLSAVQDTNRRSGNPLHPCPLAASGRHAAACHARMARINRRVSESNPTVDQPNRTRRRSRRRVSHRVSVTPGLWLFGQAESHRMERAANRQGMVRANAAARLQAIRRTRR